MGSSREILTLQFGNYSNYVGAHWWNIQESYFDYSNAESDIFHDVMFREGQNLKGEVTFTPRVILTDLKTNLNKETILGSLYEDVESDESSSAVLWDPSKVEKKCDLKSLAKHEFVEDLDLIEKGEKLSLEDKEYKFSETIQQWSDFSRCRFHPRSLNIIDNFVQHNASESFDLYSLGVQHFNASSFQEDYSDKVRIYIEECDNLDGFQILTESDDGFAGLSSSVLEMLEDEYSSKTKLVFSIFPNTYKDPSRMKDVMRMFNTVMGFQKLSEFSSLCVPLSTNTICWRGYDKAVTFPHINYQPIFYETSSILATALDTISYRYRARNDFISMSEITGSLGMQGRKFAAASLGLPFPMEPGSYLLDTLENIESSSLWTGITPNCDIQNDKVWIQSVVLRGVQESRLRNPNRTYDGINPAYSCRTVQEMLSLYLRFSSNATASCVSSSATPLKTSIPFPQFFSPNVSRFGSVDMTAQRVAGFKVETTPVIGGLHSCKSLGYMLQSLLDELKKIKIKRFFSILDIEEDEFINIVEKLGSLRECYNEDFDF